MTSRTDHLRSGSCARRAARSARARGFTLVEVLLVIGILTGLASVVLVASGTIFRRAKENATKALIERLQLEIDTYKSITGVYPPDGIDSEVRNAEGTPVRGAAALYHALTSPIRVETIVGGIPRIRTSDPVSDFKEVELTPVNDDYPGVREIVDAYNEPIHYDNTFDSRTFRAQDGSVHFPPMEEGEHPPDPRTIQANEGDELSGVQYPNQNQSRAYDLWSNGLRGHDMDAKESPAIATWNLQQF